MYVPELNVFVLAIPKTGTNTISRCLGEMLGRRILPGHLTARQVIRHMGRRPQFWALIRDPVDRFVSSMNFVYGDTRISLDDAMNGAERHGTIVFKAQEHFLFGETRLWPFEEMAGMLAELGYSGPLPHENASRKRWTRVEIASHPKAEAILARYGRDFALRERAWNENRGVRALRQST